MDIYEGMIQVNNVDVYTTSHYTNREAVIDQIEAERHEILAAMTDRLNNRIDYPGASEEENAEVLKLYDRCVAALKDNEWIDDCATYRHPVFAAVRKCKVKNRYKAPEGFSKKNRTRWGRIKAWCLGKRVG